MGEIAAGPSYAVDELTPRDVVAPETEEQTASVLAEARAAETAVVPVGGGSMLHVGNPPLRYDVALSTRALRGIVEYNPADLTVVVRGGTTLDELGAELAAHGQFLPLLAPLPDRATVGGVLAANASSLWRGAYGSARDMVIGMRMALPSGEIARSGGRVVKNVAGFDLAKLFIGSYGTLGVIVEAAFKVYPAAPQRRTLLWEGATVGDTIRTASSARVAASGALALAAVNEPLGRRLGLGGPATLLTLSGTERAVAERLDSIRRTTSSPSRLLDGAEERQLLDALRDFPAQANVRTATRPSDSAVLLGENAIAEAVCFPVVGLTYGAYEDLTADEVRRLRERAVMGGGHLVVLRASGELKREVDVWGSPGPELSLMRRVKHTFDPTGIMSPGRYLGRL